MYPEIEFCHKGTFWERFSVPKCVHLEANKNWSARFSPDTFIKGESPKTTTATARPEVALCRVCLFRILRTEATKYPGRVVAVEPHREHTQQYFFTAEPDLRGGGFDLDVVNALSTRLAAISGSCRRCTRQAKWLWLSSADVQDTDDVQGISTAVGLPLCAEHGVSALGEALDKMPKANIEYFNLPYGESGAYVWVW